MIPDVTTFTLPSWATSQAAQAFFYGLAFAIVLRLVRIGIRWFSAVSGPDRGPQD